MRPILERGVVARQNTVLYAQLNQIRLIPLRLANQTMLDHGFAIFVPKNPGLFRRPLLPRLPEAPDPIGIVGVGREARIEAMCAKELCGGFFIRNLKEFQDS